jgi:hypothetical protein
MHQSPRIKPTSIKGGDTTFKAVENRLVKAVADRWDHKSADLGVGLADLPLWQVGPIFDGTPSRVLLDLVPP